MAPVRDIINENHSVGISSTLQQLSIALHKAETVHSILIEAGSYSASSIVKAQSSNKNPRTVAAFDACAPAECVTQAAVLEQRRKKEAEDKKAEL